jgi:hypothetical protein
MVSDCYMLYHWNAKLDGVEICNIVKHDGMPSGWSTWQVMSLQGKSFGVRKDSIVHMIINFSRLAVMVDLNCNFRAK